MIGHVSSRLRLLSVSLARHWLQTFIVSVPAVLASSYFYAHNLAGDGVAAARAAHAINEFSPRPSIFSYTAGLPDPIHAHRLPAVAST